MGRPRVVVFSHEKVISNAPSSKLSEMEELTDQKLICWMGKSIPFQKTAGDRKHFLLLSKQTEL